jgi:hypothetical protein
MELESEPDEEAPESNKEEVEEEAAEETVTSNQWPVISEQ